MGKIDMLILIFILCVFLNFLAIISIIVVLILRNVCVSKVQGLDNESLVEEAFLEGIYYGKYWNYEGNFGSYAVPNSYLKKKALEFKDDDSNEIIRYRKNIVKLIDIENILYVVIVLLHILGIFIAFVFT